MNGTAARSMGSRSAARKTSVRQREERARRMTDTGSSTWRIIPAILERAWRMRESSPRGEARRKASAMGMPVRTDRSASPKTGEREAAGTAATL
ncbi:MAG: hypothetical protein BWX47_01968 [candidate division Hyd24-12 bacterium ADurb.Bin004]|nr:MAG: hypothetical protein BWX47_01968 [candidate division Hyd24-12 bacterium ADurb.Bin004]